jgi:hypothetical protein
MLEESARLAGGTHPAQREDRSDGHDADPRRTAIRGCGRPPSAPTADAGGPGLDHVSLTPFREFAHEHTLVFYDHRCSGRSIGPPVTSMAWDSRTGLARCARRSHSTNGRSWGTRSAATSLSSTSSATRGACRGSSCWTLRPAHPGRSRTAEGTGRPGLQRIDRGRRAPLLQRPDRREGLCPGPSGCCPSMGG